MAGWFCLVTRSGAQVISSFLLPASGSLVCCACMSSLSGSMMLCARISSRHGCTAASSISNRQDSVLAEVEPGSGWPAQIAQGGRNAVICICTVCWTGLTTRCFLPLSAAIPPTRQPAMTMPRLQSGHLVIAWFDVRLGSGAEGSPEPYK